MKISAGYDADGIKLSRRIPKKEETTSAMPRETIATYKGRSEVWSAKCGKSVRRR